MTEHDIQAKIMLELSKTGYVFRMNAGDFWQGVRRYSKEFRSDVLTDIRMVRGLPKGFSDLMYIGFDGKVAFIECKTASGKPTSEQDKFIQNMRNKGYRAGIARSSQDAIKIIQEEKTNGIINEL